MFYFKQNKFFKSGLILILLLSSLFFFAQSNSQAATSPDAIAFRVMPNPDHLSPRRWYQENIKLKGSPQGLTVDGYEAVRDGRTVYVNAANIDLNNRHCSNNRSCSTGNPCLSGDTCVPTFYSNIYIISYNQQAENETVDIFAQILAHWKFNTNISEPEDNSETVAQSCLYSSECPAGEYCLSKKAKIIRDTKRLADLADIELILDNYQKAHDGDYPSLPAGSYVASTSLSVWPSWQATLAKELAVTLPVDPVNRLGDCSNSPGYNPTTCWNQALKKFAGIPANSQAYVYIYNGKKSYNTCALMESGYLTTLQGACAGSAVGYKVTCVDDATAWTSKYIPANVCKGQKIVETSNCGNTRVVYGTKITGECCVISDSSWSPPIIGTFCSGLPPITQTSNCNTTRRIYGTECCEDCSSANQPNCRDSQPDNSEVVNTGVCCNRQSCYKCKSGYHLETGACVANAGTYYCKEAKPIMGTEWNTVSSYTQTWTNGAWLPVDDDTTEWNSVADSQSCRFRCAEHYTWVNSICAADTRTYSCTPPKPTGTEWDEVHSYTQTWDGNTSSWLPADSTTTYNTSGVPSLNSCLYKCGANYHYDLNTTSCLPDASCGDGAVDNNYCVGGTDAGRICASNADCASSQCGEMCDNGPTSATRTQDCNDTFGVADGLPAHCADISVSGKQTCNNDCSGWDTCDPTPPTTAGATSEACNTTNPVMNGYACCEIVSCDGDGCDCCGRLNTNDPNYSQSNNIVFPPLSTGYTEVATQKFSSKCQRSGVKLTGNSCSGIAEEKTQCNTIKIASSTQNSVYDPLGIWNYTWSNNSNKLSCRLLRGNGTPGTPPANDWKILTNHTWASYKCWK